MKVIIPVAGIGSKLRPHTHTQPKALVPVAGTPILGHIVNYLYSNGLNDFVFVIGYLGEKIEQYISENFSHINSSFVLQEPREGLGHAVWLARHQIKENEEIIIYLGDTILDFDLKEFLSLTNSVVGVKKVDDPRNYGVVELNAEGLITRLEEKPSIPKSNLALAGIYRFKESSLLMECLSEMIKSKKEAKAEYHLTDGIMMAINRGVKITTIPVGNWFDCGNKESLLETNATLLKRNSEINKTLFHYENTIIIEPVQIHESAEIRNSIIGPNVSIGEKTMINNSIVSESIIGAYSQLETAVIHKSVIGNDSYLKGLSQSLNLGDSTEIDFS
ncbi:MAG TPA: sugar phosphate nucleotidyltransferase [Bacteroidia bacterium]|nr:sugar phosphate nucleotidyltransferase [Bacteroidia bacterium]HNT79612.1 sugar phosphate nucleotidyltransferase [Bacteroidia bacterium]